MSSSSDLSREEFLRLQEQLIELRNANYELKAKLKNAVSLNNEPAAKKDPLQFATRLLNRSLTEKEKETQQRLEGENEGLRTKLNQQEEEFRLQQQTFIDELNKVVRQCENLQKELETKQQENSPHHLEDGGKLEEEKQQWTTEKTNLEGDRRRSKNRRAYMAGGRAGPGRGPKFAFARGPGPGRGRAGPRPRGPDGPCMQTRYSETIRELRDKVKEMTTGIEEQSVCVRGLENTLLEVRRENEEKQKEWKETVKHKDKEIHETSGRVQQIEEKVDKLEKKLSDKEKKFDELKRELDTARHEAEMKTEKANKEIQIIRGLYLQEKTHKEDVLKQLKEVEELKQTEQITLEEKHQREMEKLKSELKEEYAKQILELRSQLEESENKNKVELRQVKENYYQEKEILERRNTELEKQVGVKDEEKQLALKKQNMLVKELQKALKEEKKRAESVEKAKEKEWHVVDPDARSSNTYDGNESISSLSALESDNVELINKLGTLQKAYAEAVDKIRHLEHENECQQREILEKSELIENWIRSRPMPAVSGTQKNENPLRKFLTNTLVGDEQVADLKEMNRKLQRMLEETLSKNMILQRDLQTLIERTEM